MQEEAPWPFQGSKGRWEGEAAVELQGMYWKGADREVLAQAMPKSDWKD